MADKEPTPGAHERFIQPLWKQGVGSTVHCVAGDATGIILAAAVTALLGFPMWIDVIVEYVAGFLLGLLVFQSLFMRKTMGGTYVENVRRSFLPELLSMNYDDGRDGAGHDFPDDGPRHAGDVAGRAAVLVRDVARRTVGFAIAYPINVWLVAQEDEARTHDRSPGKGARSGEKNEGGAHRTWRREVHARNEARGSWCSAFRKGHEL